MKTKNLYFKLNNGLKIPALGFGTWKINDGKQAIEAVINALKIGYRHIDTAAAYENEIGIGEGIKQSGIPRQDIFLVSKLWNSDQGYESTFKAFETSLKNLKTDYLDMYLIHWPKGELSKQSWKALEKLYEDGQIKAIGVCNFHKHHLEYLFPICEIKPMLNQVEFHPYLTQQDLFDFCREHKIQPEAWSPLMQGKILNIPLLPELAKKYNRTIAEIILRWDIQKGVVTIPKSVNPQRIKENFQSLDFELSNEDMDKISSLNRNQRIGPDPDNFNF